MPIHTPQTLLMPQWWSRPGFIVLMGHHMAAPQLWGAGGYRRPLVAWVAQHRRFILRVTWHPEGWKSFVLLPHRSPTSAAGMPARGGRGVGNPPPLLTKAMRDLHYG